MPELLKAFPERPASFFRPVITLTKQQDLRGQVLPYEPCTCGSGKKFKFCCYQSEGEEKNIAQADRAAAILAEKGLSQRPEGK
jgi:hypothetical protein